MSYDWMVKRQAELEAEVDALLGEAERIDAEEDERFESDRRGDEIPAELARREGRLAKLRAAKEALETAARAADVAAPKPKAQRNFTGPSLGS